MYWRVIGPKPRLDLRTPSQKAVDAIAHIDRSEPASTRAAWALAAVDKTLAAAKTASTPCYFCGAPHPDPGTPCPRCRDGAVGARSNNRMRSSDTRPVGPVYHHPGGRIIGIR